VLAWIYVGVTIALTVYGQLAYKWVADDAGPFPSALGERVSYLVDLALDPRMISVGLATLGAAVTWFLALKSLELAQAYPFMSLSFVGVLLLSGVFFGEAVTTWRAVGVAFICLGVILGSRGLAE
jgi:multidrug transporter EmrE-like cation transporter